MAEPDPRTVYVADSVKLAEAVIQLLASAGIAAEVAQSGPQTTTDPLTGMSEMVTPDEFPIVVTEPTRLNDARELLTTAENMTALRAVKEKRAARTGNVTAVCEDCGKSSEWPAKALGTTEVCPHCSNYMDIPDPDEDWSDVDFGEEEEEDEEAK